MQQRKKVKDKDPELTFQAHTVQAQPVPRAIQVSFKSPFFLSFPLSYLQWETSLASPENSRQGAAKLSLQQGTVLTLANLKSRQRKQTLDGGMSVQASEKHLEEGTYLGTP